jgi:hypothetical protein
MRVVGGLFNLMKTKPVKVTSEVFMAASIHITLKMQAASTSETSVNLNQTIRCNNPEDSHLHNLCIFRATFTRNAVSYLSE